MSSPCHFLSVSPSFILGVVPKKVILLCTSFIHDTGTMFLIVIKPCIMPLSGTEKHLLIYLIRTPTKSRVVMFNSVKCDE